MGHVNLKMIHENYGYIENYQRDEGAAFMNNVYDPNAAPCDKAGGDAAGRVGQMGTG
jgi:hypothetical protein